MRRINGAISSFRVAPPATQLVSNALELNLSSTDRAGAAIVKARAGDSNGAQKLIGELRKQYPLDTMVNYGVQTASAAVELNNNNPEKALQLLEPTARYEYSGAWNILELERESYGSDI